MPYRYSYSHSSNPTPSLQFCISQAHDKFVVHLRGGNRVALLCLGIHGLPLLSALPGGLLLPDYIHDAERCARVLGQCGRVGRFVIARGTGRLHHQTSPSSVQACVLMRQADDTCAAMHEPSPRLSELLACMHALLPAATCRQEYEVVSIHAGKVAMLRAHNGAYLWAVHWAAYQGEGFPLKL